LLASLFQQPVKFWPSYHRRFQEKPLALFYPNLKLKKVSFAEIAFFAHAPKVRRIESTTFRFRNYVIHMHDDAWRRRWASTTELAREAISKKDGVTNTQWDSSLATRQAC